MPATAPFSHQSVSLIIAATSSTVDTFITDCTGNFFAASLHLTFHFLTPFPFRQSAKAAQQQHLRGHTHNDYFHHKIALYPLPFLPPLKSNFIKSTFVLWSVNEHCVQQPLLGQSYVDYFIKWLYYLIYAAPSWSTVSGTNFTGHALLYSSVQYHATTPSPPRPRLLLSSSFPLQLFPHQPSPFVSKANFAGRIIHPLFLCNQRLPITATYTSEILSDFRYVSSPIWMHKY